MPNAFSDTSLSSEMAFAPGVQLGRGVDVVLALCDPQSGDRSRPTSVVSHRQVRILSVRIVLASDDLCNNALNLSSPPALCQPRAAAVSQVTPTSAIEIA